MAGGAQRQKKTVSVTLDPLLYDQARQAGVNLSALLAAALVSELRSVAAAQWKQQNQQTLAELNRITEEHGLLSDEYRTF